MPILFLPQHVYHKIAAAETIQRPESVVRELLDNSIDSQAQSIDVQIVNGGKTLIQVKDNGHGMSHHDLAICFLKHTTSKIQSFEDIHLITSMGFRGEALHSIAVTSQLSIASKTQNSKLGSIVQISNGKLLSQKPIPLNTGTLVKVQNLFSLFPVRFQTLKSENYEFSKIKNTFLQKSIPFYHSSFNLSHNGKKILQLFKTQSLQLRIQALYEKNLFQNLIPLNASFEKFQIIAFVSKPNFFKNSKRYQLLYINQRIVSFSLISQTIIAAYHNILPKGLFPVAFFFVQIPPQLLDINVHPSKQEIKILIEKSFHQSLYQLLQKAIQKNPNFPKIHFQQQVKQSVQQFQQHHHQTPSHQTPNYPYKPSKLPKISQPKTQNLPPLTQPQQQKSFPKLTPQYHSYQILGTVFDTYILISKAQTLLLLDQHALHERLQYEKIKKKLQTQKSIPSQILLQPAILEIPPSYQNVIHSYAPQISKLGFEIHPFGKSCFNISAYPYFFLNLDQAKIALIKLFDHLIDSSNIPSPIQFVDQSLKMQSCKSSIKSGQHLSHTEIHSIISELNLFNNSFACPHGRPTTLYIDKIDLEKLFLRKK